ncbi:MAG: hypothetical protein ACLURV_01415 [Gallintestinimicrobium sp.]
MKKQQDGRKSGIEESREAGAFGKQKFCTGQNAAKSKHSSKMLLRSKTEPPGFQLQNVPTLANAAAQYLHLSYEQLAAKKHQVRNCGKH